MPVCDKNDITKIPLGRVAARIFSVLDTNATNTIGQRDLIDNASVLLDFWDLTEKQNEELLNRDEWNTLFSLIRDKIGEPSLMIMVKKILPDTVLEDLVQTYNLSTTTPRQVQRTSSSRQPVYLKCCSTIGCIII